MQPLRSVGLGLGGVGLGLVGLGLVAITVRLGWANFVAGHVPAPPVGASALSSGLPNVLALRSDSGAAKGTDDRSNHPQSLLPR
ncbi:MAG TPA: hypothetical protein VFQ61_29370, partial [Polyangiaceae bacterium]|nr:hypothetical protein [Polyangiaceae bacterium]